MENIYPPATAGGAGRKVVTFLAPSFIITREDQVVDPVTLSTQALRVGRQIDCEILLNHPTVSRLHAGINIVDGRFYLINLSSSHPVTLNGRLVELNDAEALADGDVAQIGSFFLHMSRVGDALNIHVQVQVAGNIAEVIDDADEEHPLTPETATTSPQVADALKEFWDKRTRDKVARPSPLHPRHPTRPGKSQFNWAPTRDLLHPWRSSIFVWALIVVGTISMAAALWYAKAFSPAPLSRPHVQASLAHSASDSAIAKQPNANACTTCHTLSIPMEVNCASCHQTAAFAAGLSGIPAHAQAGVGCVSCHAEHLGADFLPAEAAVTACAKCHNDENKEHYHGRRVSTPHGGTVGYPVKAGKWMWKGLSDDEWNQRPDASTEAIKRVRTRLPNETEDKWRSRQFHILHLYRVIAREVGLPGDDAGAMSCSSCHKSFDPIDRATPATTCVRCHNGDRGLASILGKGLLIDADSPNCISCHVQHVRQTRHWNLRLLAPRLTSG